MPEITRKQAKKQRQKKRKQHGQIRKVVNKKNVDNNPATEDNPAQQKPPATTVVNKSFNWSNKIYENAESIKKYFESFFNDMSKAEQSKTKGKSKEEGPANDNAAIEDQAKANKAFFDNLIKDINVTNNNGNIEIVTAAGTSKHTKLDNNTTKKQFFTKDDEAPDLESIYSVYAFEAFIEKKMEITNGEFDPATLDKTTDISADQQLAQMDIITINKEELKGFDEAVTEEEQNQFLNRHKAACEAAFKIYFKEVKINFSVSQQQNDKASSSGSHSSVLENADSDSDSIDNEFQELNSGDSSKASENNQSDVEDGIKDKIQRLKENNDEKLKKGLQGFFDNNQSNLNDSVKNNIQNAIENIAYIQLHVLKNNLPKTSQENLAEQINQFEECQQQLQALEKKFNNSNDGTAEVLKEYRGKTDEQTGIIGKLVAEFAVGMPLLNASYAVIKQKKASLAVSNVTLLNAETSVTDNLNDFLLGIKTVDDVVSSVNGVASLDPDIQVLTAENEKYSAEHYVAREASALLATANTLKDKKAKLTGSLATIKGIKNKLGKVADHKDKLDSVFALVKTLSERRIDDGYKTDWDKINADFIKLEAEWQKLVDAVDTELKTLGVDAAKLSALNDFCSLNTRFSTIGETLNELAYENKVKRQVEGVESKVEFYSKQIDSLAKQNVSGMSADDLAKLKEKASAYSEKIKALEPDIKGLENNGVEVDNISEKALAAMFVIDKVNKKITDEENKPAKAPVAEKSFFEATRQRFSKYMRGDKTAADLNEAADAAAKAPAHGAALSGGSSLFSPEPDGGKSNKEKQLVKKSTVSITFGSSNS